MYLYGASGHAKVILDILLSQGIHVEALIDDNKELTELHGIPIIHSSGGLHPVIISIGNNKIRKVISEQIVGPFGIAVHSSAIISIHARIGEGTVVMQNAVVQSDTTIGRHCIINTASTVDHDCIIEDYVHISPNASLCGNIYVGEGTQIGVGAAVIPGIKIGKWSVVGAGSVVITDIPDNCIAFGNPCKVIKYINR